MSTRTTRRRAAGSLGIYPGDLPPGDVTKADIRRLREERPNWLTAARDRYRRDSEDAAHQAAATARAALAHEEAADAMLGITEDDYCTGTDGCATCTTR